MSASFEDILKYMPLKTAGKKKKCMPDASARLEGSRPKRRLSPRRKIKAGKKKAGKKKRRLSLSRAFFASVFVLLY